ncbi:DUF1365 domain-containing protein [Paralimibaculum aggregatum]|uniref:DUF1365 domain-containing protein n=1 Tax=Paralimibaculum aggregatum TaxID=3036245 RepID=A0ABQ6LQA7_9RHOB|nr:DUF1365 domain-containing protein [Limibaculum sp. NKW23]GMG84725.1 DUF1365 domain-containing protein [Limibaculum sp. NKW23]
MRPEPGIRAAAPAPAEAPAETLAETPAACLYPGHVMHMRLSPFAHRFRYRVFTLLIDADRMAETCAPLRLLGFERRRLLSLWRRDHGPRDGTDLRPWVEARLAERGLPRPARIWLLSFPRILGYAFNPLSVYFCHDEAGALESVVYEVKNTFGDQHAYALPARPGRDGTVRHETDKGFFVSPFIGMDQRYAFTIRAPGERLALRIRQGDGSGPWLIAAQTGRRRPLSDASLLARWLSHPLMTVKVFAAIHWQALRLWRKGARFHRYRGPYPQADAAARQTNLG